MKKVKSKSVIKMVKKINKKGMATWLEWLLGAIFFIIALLAIGYFAKRIGVL